MTPITLSHPEAHEKLTAKLFWKRTSESGYNSVGNVRDYVNASTRSLVTRARADDGARFVNDEQGDVHHECWTFLLDERSAEQEVLLNIARQLDNHTQAYQEGATATVSDVVKGKWFDIGAYNIANVEVSASVSGGLEEGTDYDLDKENGRLFLRIDAGVDNGESLTLLFDEPGIEFQKFETQFNPLFYCDLIIEEHNQYSKVWLRRLSFTGYVNVTEFPSQTGEFGTYRVKVTASGPITYLKRPEAQTLPDHTEGGGPANSSSSQDSSSSSPSSASSKSSRSSQSRSSTSSQSYSSSSGT